MAEKRERCNATKPNGDWGRCGRWKGHDGLHREMGDPPLDSIGWAADPSPSAPSLGPLTQPLTEIEKAELLDSIPNHLPQRMALRRLLSETDRLRGLVETLTQERDSWRQQFDTLRIDMGWTPSEQANEIMRLRAMLDGAASLRATLLQREEEIARLREALQQALDGEGELRRLLVTEREEWRQKVEAQKGSR